MDMGYPDYGGGSAVAHGPDEGAGAVAERHHGQVAAAAPAAGAAARATGTVAPGGAQRTVPDLAGPREGTPDVAVTLTARAGTIELASGERVPGFTVNGTSPGPTIEAAQGDLVEVTLVNESVADGAALHWHGIDVPNAEDGVAGVTQDAVPVGGEHVYRFVVEDAGTYWYHSHQVSHEQVVGGLFGTVVVRPDDAPMATGDLVLPVHTYDGVRTIAGHARTHHVPLVAGTQARLRVVNTDSAATNVWVAGAEYRLLAVDGHEVDGPEPLTDVAFTVPGGGRVDLGLVVPADGVVLHAGGGAAVAVGGQDPGSLPATAGPDAVVDLLTYGTPSSLPFDPAAADRRYEYAIGRRPGFVDGRPGLWWTINGHLYPDVPMYMLEEGDLVVMTISNSSGTVHPMHLHGHHVLVLSRDGVPSTGSQWWTDTLDVRDGETYEVAFVADNPGIWLDHCHNLQHAADGMLAHLAYAGVTTPYVLGGEAGNRPE
ncbi:multicopper oxidase family protein [Georgenia yuyongxinii]|uniref:Multicopper oxidase family protein n=2 Tax=Georgenia yuyongxinii TaxID=2589797 RepID=A0A5B8C7K5_9MICO|nr:multicopper oxidase family protein [Georgenia yuyongxinii]